MYIQKADTFSKSQTAQRLWLRRGLESPHALRTIDAAPVFRWETQHRKWLTKRARGTPAYVVTTTASALNKRNALLSSLGFYSGLRLRRRTTSLHVSLTKSPALAQPSAPVVT